MKKSAYILILLALAFGAGIAIALSSGSSDKQPAQDSTQATDNSPVAPNTIVMDGSGFSPNRLTVKVEDSVTFINRDSEDHWPASNDHPSHKIYSDLDSKKPIKPGESWSFTLERAGQWGMHDHLFPKTKATIIVTP
ncbi:hypothetical protein A3E49_03330 [Candidatus Saccharibacteria bacterium RIFCSPHIGHO2_12_FULL_49_19]|nr:MAG: hypothetical protein A2708_01630 [Candidatus Saccharibacteria bacterium RIFCSPHIGHO2_01_FULL_49_21]OGL36947.1 MAG: hypothetical protein A3E49_03330 [Candidatus Saccharibacteria bacterium RIFCSPHIGHO2_12_FULL_49_19]OGL37760.1 MAG: hypothetical protein A3B63_00205 [Candidatus Saccharibacteria bacterium RIFCSPLOWO2_01_FULL_49_22]